MMQDTAFIQRNKKNFYQLQNKILQMYVDLCSGTKFLCGKSRCPVLVKFHSRDKVKPLINYFENWLVRHHLVFLSEDLVIQRFQLVL